MIFQVELIYYQRISLAQLSDIIYHAILEVGEMKGKSILTNKIESEIELLERHVKMLNAIMEHEPIGIIRLSELLDIPQHKVRYSLRILEQEGLINPSPEGAVTTEKLQTFFTDLKDILQHMDETVNALRTSLETQVFEAKKINK